MQKTLQFAAGLSLLALFLFSSCASKVAARIRAMQEIQKHGIAFRLHDYKQRYEYFEKNGLSERAAKERADNERYNRQLVSDFRKHFDFCPVQFFYASQVNDLKAGKPVLLNADLQPDASIPLPEKVIVAGCEYSENMEGGIPWIKYFQIEDSSLKTRQAKFSKWLAGRQMNASSVIRVNRIMHSRAGD
jgi:hypothetical protein